MKIGVLGGGPSGLLTGSILSGGGFDVTVFEEHREVGVPNHCTSVVSRETLLESQVDAEKTVVAKLKGVRLGIPEGPVLTHKSREVKALVIDRPTFDKQLALSFLDNGGRLRLGTRARITEEGRKYVVADGNGEGSFDVVVDAGGASSFLRRDRSERSVLSGIQFDVLDDELDREVAEIWVDKETNPDFFLWCVPVDSEVVRVGTAWGISEGEERLAEFVEWRFGATPVVSKYYGPVIVSGYLLPFYQGNTVYVGDSAGQTKPTTGGGLRYGLSGSRMAAEALLGVVSGGDVESSLVEYQRKWLSTWKKDVDWQKRAKTFFRALGNRELRRLLRWMRKEEVLPALIERGHLDVHEKLIRIALEKNLLRTGLDALGGFVKGMIPR